MAHFKPDEASLAALRGKRVLAFAGIGDPARFFATLREAGVEVAGTRVFPDHHPLTPDETANLVAEAEGSGLALVTTEKDLARLRTPEGLPDWARSIVPFKVTVNPLVSIVPAVGVTTLEVVILPAACNVPVVIVMPPVAFPALRPAEVAFTIPLALLIVRVPV